MPRTKRKNLLIGVLGVAIFWGGCSNGYWTGKWHMLVAESEMDKAAGLKDKRIHFEKRVPHYRKACGHFQKVYQTAPQLFTLNRIELAVDACWKSGQRDEEALFSQFREIYVKDHPHEEDYGDPGEILTV